MNLTRLNSKSFQKAHHFNYNLNVPNHWLFRMKQVYATAVLDPPLLVVHVSIVPVRVFWGTCAGIRHVSTSCVGVNFIWKTSSELFSIFLLLEVNLHYVRTINLKCSCWFVIPTGFSQISCNKVPNYYRSPQPCQNCNRSSR